MSQLSGLFKLSTQDLAKGLVMAVIAAVVTYVSDPTFDVTTLDWGYMLKMVLTVVISYLAKNLLTDVNGKVLGKI